MIQRIQTIWLLLASILIFLCLKLSFFSGTHLPDNLYHQLNGTENLLLMTCTIALGILALFNIFLYKNRVVQLRLCTAGILLEAFIIFLYFKETQHFSKGDYAITAGFHILIIVAFILAARGINKDEKLIRDSDRLR